MVVKDVYGQTGLKIIKAICSGETDSEKRSDLRHYNCRKSKEEISRTLKTNGRKDFLFVLNQELEMYEIFESKMSEMGLECIRRFPTANHFVSWLRFAPNNKISGGKVLSSKVPKGSSSIKIALRRAANAIGNLKDSIPLSDFFKRINFRKGRVSAISATARKLAVIIWNMVVKCVPYNNPEGYLYLDQKRKLGIVKRINKQITRDGFSTEDLNLVTS